MSEPTQKPEDQPSGFVASWDEVSARLGTTARQWVTYSKRPGFPGKTAEGYNLAALAAWKAENVGNKSDSTLKAAKAEKLAEEIALLRIRRAKEERKSVSMEDVDELHRVMGLKMRSYLYSKLDSEAPPKLAGCDALAIRKYLRGVADEIVKNFGQGIDDWKES